jgi:hypothetical protein
MPKAVVLADSLGYYDEDGRRFDAEKGETVELSQEDFDRHLEAGNVAKPQSKDAKAAAEESEAES